MRDEIGRRGGGVVRENRAMSRWNEPLLHAKSRTGSRRCRSFPHLTFPPRGPAQGLSIASYLSLSVLSPVLYSDCIPVFPSAQQRILSVDRDS